MYHKKAINYLSKYPLLKRVFSETVLPSVEHPKDVYSGLLQSITSQQLSVKAAATIYDRFINLFENQYPDPIILLKMDISQLKSVGLSKQKANYVQNVADFFINQKLLDMDWSQKSDEAIIEQLTIIKGVGKWTVQMILMFILNRPDVFPIDDLGIQKAMLKLYEIEDKFGKSSADQKAMKKELIELAEPWRPYRSIACKYLWKWY